jgi:hypothetical protein
VVDISPYKQRQFKKPSGPPKIVTCKKCQWMGTNYLGHSCEKERIRRGMIKENHIEPRGETNPEPVLTEKASRQRFKRIIFQSDSESVHEILFDDESSV